ncbi:VP2 protein [Mole Culex virus]|nr:VP2 protein [Mole Culex virus]
MTHLAIHSCILAAHLTLLSNVLISHSQMLYCASLAESDPQTLIPSSCKSQFMTSYPSSLHTLRTSALVLLLVHLLVSLPLARITTALIQLCHSLCTLWHTGSRYLTSWLPSRRQTNQYSSLLIHDQPLTTCPDSSNPSISLVEQTLFE